LGTSKRRDPPERANSIENATIKKRLAMKGEKRDEQQKGTGRAAKRPNERKTTWKKRKETDRRLTKHG